MHSASEPFLEGWLFQEACSVLASFSPLCFLNAHNKAALQLKLSFKYNGRGLDIPDNWKNQGEAKGDGQRDGRSHIMTHYDSIIQMCKWPRISFALNAQIWGNLQIKLERSIDIPGAVVSKLCCTSDWYCNPISEGDRQTPGFSNYFHQVIPMCGRDCKKLASSWIFQNS